MTTPEWEHRLAAVWARRDDVAPDQLVDAVEALAAELPDDSAVAAFERACAQDSTGHPDIAVGLYRRALELGLGPERRRRAVIQLASSVRNLGQAPQSVRLLEEETLRGSDDLDDAVRAFLALALVDGGRERDAVAVALTALAPHLPRYQRALTAYAAMLVPSPAGALVRGLYERYQARDWDAAARLVHEDVTVQMPATGERLDGREQMIAFQRDYPEPWGDLVVLRVVDDGVTTAAELDVTGAPVGDFRCVAMWTALDGLLHRGIEYWVTAGRDDPPPHRPAQRP